MHALDQKLEDAFFVGETYGSYIRCGDFTLQGDIHKSLPWLQRSVRSLTIYFLGTFTHSNKEVVDFLLDASWKCASAEVKLEWISSLEGFVKALIKKFRTLATIKNAIPSIWFSSRENEGEGLQLNCLLLDPEVTKLEPPDSHNAEAAYIVSNGRNRMQIEIFKRPDFEEERDIYDNDYDEYF
ncbi:hypothetical protein Ddc_16318 [Ditylenchus destructor]|nr:hypothetical protein Ddc_16318 [Ditylenchus destructor]